MSKRLTSPLSLLSCYSSTLSLSLSLSLSLTLRMASQCEFCGSESDSRASFFPSTLSLVKIITPTSRNHLRSIITPTRSANGRSLGTFEQNNVFSDVGKHLA